MSDPRRWVDDPGAPELERDALLGAPDVDPPDGEQARLWGALSAQIGAGGAGGAAAGAAGAAGGGVAAGGAVGIKAASASAASLGVIGLAKWAVVGALGAGALIGTGRIVAPSNPPGFGASASVTAVPSARPPSIARPVVPSPNPAAAPSDSAPRAVVVSAPAPSWPSAAAPDELAAPAASQPFPSTTAPIEPAPTSSALRTQSSPEERMNRLREESRRVALVREALRRGDGQAASALLDQLRREFPEAVLAQEREALSIETLARQGRRAEARARATTFLNTWPSSVYAETVRLYNQ